MCFCGTNFIFPVEQLGMGGFFDAKADEDLALPMLVMAERCSSNAGTYPGLLLLPMTCISWFHIAVLPEDGLLLHGGFGLHGKVTPLGIGCC